MMDNKDCKNISDKTTAQDRNQKIRRVTGIIHPKMPQTSGSIARSTLDPDQVAQYIGTVGVDTGLTDSAHHAHHRTKASPVKNPWTVGREQLQEEASESHRHTAEEHFAFRNELRKKKARGSSHRTTSRMDTTRNDSS